MYTKDLTGIKLDWAVAQALKIPVKLVRDQYDRLRLADKELYEMEADEDEFAPSTNADQGLRLIRKEKVATWPDTDVWNAVHPERTDSGFYSPDLGRLDVDCYDGVSGPTLLIAAMRAICICYLGDRVEIPEPL